MATRRLFPGHQLCPATPVYTVHATNVALWPMQPFFQVLYGETQRLDNRSNLGPSLGEVFCQPKFSRKAVQHRYKEDRGRHQEAAPALVPRGTKSKDLRKELSNAC